MNLPLPFTAAERPQWATAPQGAREAPPPVGTIAA